MANKLITDLAATTAPASTTVVPVVRSGQSVAEQSTLANLAKGFAAVGKVAVTQPASASTITVVDGATLTVSASATVTNGTHSGTNTGDQDLTSSGTGNLVRVSNATLVAPALGTPASGTLTNCTGLPASGIESGALAEQVLIGLDPAGSADEKWSGISVAGTAGATLVTGDLVYLDVTATEWLLADADAAATAGDVPLGICVAAANDGQATTILLFGTIRSAAFPASIALGAPVYVDVTAGDFSATKPSGTDDVVRRVGWAITAEPNTIFFNPSNDFITVV